MMDEERHSGCLNLLARAQTLATEELEETPVQQAESRLPAATDAVTEGHSKTYFHIAKATFSDIARRIGGFGAGTGRFREPAASCVDGRPLVTSPVTTGMPRGQMVQHVGHPHLRGRIPAGIRE